MESKKLILQFHNKGREDNLEVIAPVLSNTYNHFEIITTEKHLEWLKVGDIFEKICLFPKAIFLYDEKLHGEGCINEDVFEA